MSSSEENKIQVFLSYSSDDSNLAGDIKENLEDINLEVFLAHEDIDPSSEWLEEILRNLKECDIFIPIISENFRNSKWTDQESGIAFILNKRIIPIRVDLVPYGFIGKYQALKLGDSISDCCDQIRDTILKTPDYLIKAFVNSWSFHDANEKAELLSKYEEFTLAQINDIISGFINNNQIRGAWTARRVVKQLYDNLNEFVSPELRRKFEEMYELDI